MKMTSERKVCLVTSGHATKTQASIACSSVVSRQSARLAFLIAELNSVDVTSRDLENACLDVPCQEKIWFEGGQECGEDHSKVLILAGALHGLKIMGASWRAMLAEVLEDLAFESVKADPDVWIRLAVQDDDFEHCEMILVCVDDVLATSHTAKIHC